MQAEQPGLQRWFYELSRASARFAILWETLPQYFQLLGTAHPGAAEHSSDLPAAPGHTSPHGATPT